MKRAIDIVAALVGLILLSWLLLVAWLVAAIDTRSSGLFLQERVGRHGKRFRVVKLRTMRPVVGIATTATTRNDPRITTAGAWLRTLKLDELPQLWNVLVGEMSLVGPRPDVPGFSDQLQGEARRILEVRPGITGPASLAFRNEEDILAGAECPEQFNREVIWPAKVAINLRYVNERTLLGDLLCILATILPGLARSRFPAWNPKDHAE